MFLSTCRNIVKFIKTTHSQLKIVEGHISFKKATINKNCVNLNSRSNCHFRPQFYRFFSTSRLSTPNKPSNNRKYLLWATYVSFGIGACIFLVIGKSYIVKVKRRARGIEDEKPQFVNSKKAKFIRYRGFVLPSFTENILDKIETFEVRPDDVWVISFPRSGTTWTQEMVYLISTKLDLQKAQSLSIDERFPYLEYITPGIDAVDKMPSPRFIKTHMPLKFLPKDLTKAKVIYVARNPKDTVVSYFHFVKMFKAFDGEFKDFLDQFVNSKVGYSPWTEHVLEFWKLRDDPNVLFLKYEDMMEDLEGCIRRVAEFLDKPLTDNEVKVISQQCCFTSMKDNKQVNYEWMKDLGLWDKSDPDNTFLRKGKVGQWRQFFDESINYKMNRMIAYKFQNIDLRFKYDLEKK